MSKRGAGFQLTRFEHEAERAEVPIEEVTKASNDVMARRQIAPRPKARNAPVAPSASAPIANPFASFGQAPKPTAAAPSSATSTTSNGPSETSRARLVGLNNRFAKTIEEYSKTNVAGSWAAACEKYLNYVKSIETDPVSSAVGHTPTSSSADRMGTNSASNSGTTAPTGTSGTPAFKPPTNFTFGKPAAESSSGAPVKFEAPKSFTFGQSSTSAAPPADKKEAPKFTFGQSAPSESVAAPAEKKDGSAVPKFSFGGQPKINFTGSSEPPKFTFGANSTSNSAATPAAQEPAKFSFGASSAPSSDAPKFSFGQKESSSEESSKEAPKFSFGNSSSSGTAPAKFSFGNTSNAAPKFTFGSSGSSDTANKFSFGQPSAGTANVNQTWKPSEKPAETEAGTDNNDDDELPAEAQQDFTGKGAGEESEDSVFEVRTKLYDSKNESAGLGVLRLLVHRETKKSRVVVRADGSGRVLINTILPQAVNYTATKNFVSIPTFGADKPVTFRARVKNEEVAKELADKLNEFKA